MKTPPVRVMLVCTCFGAVFALGMPALASEPEPVMTEELMQRLISYARTMGDSGSVSGKIARVFELAEGSEDFPLQLIETERPVGTFLGLPVAVDSKDILILQKNAAGHVEAYLTDASGRLRAAAIADGQPGARLITNERAAVNYAAVLSALAREAAEDLPPLDPTPPPPAPTSSPAIPHYNAGVRKYRAGDLNGALADFTEAIARDATHWKSYTSRGVTKRDLGDLDGAIRDHSRAIELNPRNAGPFSNRGVVFRDQGDLAAALADYSTALSLDPADYYTYNNRGVVRADQNDLDGAMADFTRSIELRADYADAYFNRSLTRKSQGDVAGAAADKARAGELDPRFNK